MPGDAFGPGVHTQHRPAPITIRPEELALYLTVDLDGRAQFGGRLGPADTVSTLRFLADGIEAGQISEERQP